MSLRIMSLNCWAGQHYADLMKYLLQASYNCDVICLQEVHRCLDDTAVDRVMPQDPGTRTHPIRIKLFQELEQMLSSNFDCYFAPQLSGYLHDLERSEMNVEYGNAMFIRKGLNMQAYESAIVFGEFNQPNEQLVGGLPSAKSGQLVSLLHRKQIHIISHFHGHWDQDGKVDTVHREQQSARVLEWLEGEKNNFPNQKIQLALMGDFNYTSDMQALARLRDSTVFGKTGGRHLNKGLLTRTRYYTDNPAKKKSSKEAGHVIVSHGLANESDLFIDLEAPSDHAAFFLKT